MGDAAELTVSYPADFDSGIFPGGYTSPTWNGYNTAVAGAFFADVSAGDPFYAEIQWMGNSELHRTGRSAISPSTNPRWRCHGRPWQRSYTGCPGDTFSAPAVPTFADVPSDSPFFQQIEWMAAQGTSTGAAQETGKPLLIPLMRCHGRPWPVPVPIQRRHPDGAGGLRVRRRCHELAVLRLHCLDVC